MVFKQLTLIGIFIGIFNHFLSAHPDDIKKCTPTRLHSAETLQKINTLVEEEKKERTINTPGNTKQDYGFSVPRINPLHESILTLIAQAYEEGDEHPLFLDLGAGRGSMGWKAMVAGAYVRAMEKQQPTAELMCKNMMKAKPFLAKGETVNKLCKIKCADVLAFDDPFYTNYRYDFVWAGYLYHFFTPSQTEELTSRLFKCMKEGAFIGITVNAPSSNSTIVNLYNSRRDKGETYPGFMMLNQEIYRECNLLTGHQQNSQVKIISAVALDKDSSSLPGEEKYGYYGEETKEVVWEKDKLTGVMQVNKRKTHKPFHFMGPDVLQRLFETAGFKVEELYYLSDSNKKIPWEKMTEKQLVARPQLLLLLARKPNVSQHSQPGAILENEPLNGKKELKDN